MNRLRLSVVCIAAAFIFIITPKAGSFEIPAYPRLADAHLCMETEPCIELAGEVLQVFLWQYSEMSSEPSHGIVLKMRGATGEFLAYMGPKRFNEQMGNVFSPGDWLAITGVLATVNGAEMLIGKSYSHGGVSTSIRNDMGRLLSLR